jgi:hypothetical protein
MGTGSSTANPNGLGANIGDAGSKLAPNGVTSPSSAR